jgi:phage shock protein A
MAAQSILGRTTQMARANILAMLDAADDPQAMLDQMIRDYRTCILEAEDAVTQMLGNLRLMESDAQEAKENAHAWANQARAAGDRADQLRAAGNATEAERFDNLARIAIGRQLTCERDAARFEPIIAGQTVVTDRLKTGLMQMHTKLDDLNRKRDEPVGRARPVEAGGRAVPSAINAMDPAAELSRFEEKIRRAEARVSGRELMPSTVDIQFEALDDAARDAEVEARLATLKRHKSRA